MLAEKTIACLQTPPGRAGIALRFSIEHGANNDCLLVKCDGVSEPSVRPRLWCCKFTLLAPDITRACEDISRAGVFTAAIGANCPDDEHVAQERNGSAEGVVRRTVGSDYFSLLNPYSFR